MPIEYEDIQKGRRREWEKLRDPEELRREKKEAREADPDYKKKMAAAKKKAMAREVEKAEDLAKWYRVRRESVIILSIVFGGMFLWFGINFVINQIRISNRMDKVQELAALVNAGEEFRGQEDAVEAWATWRSAWQRRSATDIYLMSSAAQQRRYRGRTNEAVFLRDFQNRIESGRLDKYAHIAEQFDDPEITHVPLTPSDGDLAVFRTDFQDPRLQQSESQEWVLALSYDDEADRWEFEDLRHESSWSDRWVRAAHIPKSRRPIDGSGGLGLGVY